MLETTYLIVFGVLFGLTKPEYSVAKLHVGSCNACMYVCCSDGFAHAYPLKEECIRICVVSKRIQMRSFDDRSG